MICPSSKDIANTLIICNSKSGSGGHSRAKRISFSFFFLAFSFSYFFARCMMLAVCHGENFSWPLEGLSMFGSMHMIRREKREKDGYRNKPNHKWLHINNSKNQIIQGFSRQLNPEVSKSVYPEICTSALITSHEFWKFSSEMKFIIHFWQTSAVFSIYHLNCFLTLSHCRDMKYSNVKIGMTKREKASNFTLWKGKSLLRRDTSVSVTNILLLVY